MYLNGGPLLGLFVEVLLVILVSIPNGADPMVVWSCLLSQDHFRSNP